ncbi:hypothetical protein TRFO_20546 [Tritrichomonas foetus]|uniref:Uncharacterized protein n=1 Tax=Tritrichomonas foetus TaxID=1144522 RepID=A0A1J4KGU8_9EUKA|nr:hypothetical protein TRFO_20546 [Tritrichomonas foetus]|eukprot:OHT10176.1 hypothetical protein TRFO_20546 [Tritrichomonas foetus]
MEFIFKKFQMLINILSLISLCNYNYSIKQTIPIYVDQQLSQGETICVNTSVYYSNVIFNTRVNTVFDVYDEFNIKRVLGLENYYIRASAINFGKIVGSLVITALNKTRVSFGAVAFPNDKCDIKIISNSFRDFVYLKYDKSSVCYFNTNGLDLRFHFHLTRGEMTLYGPNSSIQCPKHEIMETAGYLPFIIFNSPNETIDESPHFVIVGTQIHKYPSNLPLRISSNEPGLLESTQNNCTEPETNSTDLEIWKSLQDEKEMKLGILITMMVFSGLIFLFYIFSLCYICPCCVFSSILKQICHCFTWWRNRSSSKSENVTQSEKDDKNQNIDQNVDQQSIDQNEGKGLDDLD